MTDDSAEPVVACHLMLLRLAGSVPDELLTRCRQWLAEGRIVDVAVAIADGLPRTPVSLAHEDRALLEDVLTLAGRDPGVLSAVEPAPSHALPQLWFVGRPPEDLGRALADRATRIANAATTAVADLPGVRGLWCSWRLPPEGASPRQIFVVEVEPDEDLVAITATLQDDLSAAGELSPQVEVYPVGGELPAYQRFARGGGELLWAASPDPGIRLARLFDEVDPGTGRWFAAGHPRLDDAVETAQVLAYLNAGAAVLTTTARMDDVIDQEQVEAVPLSFRTDGTFIWTDASAYYLDKHALAPDADLLAHIRAGGYLPPTVDGVALHRATAFLQKPFDDEQPEQPESVHEPSSASG